ncbi:MAG: hypothetical protein IKW86_11350 [Salinivirgaceae bacterium]|nr:hypothetical protein [Salinivirgaceae bacterium]
MNNNKITAYKQEGQLMLPGTFVKELDEDSVKELHLDDMMEDYNKCLCDEGFLYHYSMRQYLINQTPFVDSSENEQKTIIETLYKNWQPFYAQNRLTILEYIKEQVQYINECCAPIYERRKRVSYFFNSIKDRLLTDGHISPTGKIKLIGYNIPDVIFNDIYHILADALCCRFQLNQFDGKYRDGMYHCLQYLDYRYHYYNSDKQYPNATKEEKEKYKRTNFLDIVTGRHNASIEVQGDEYKCSAYLNDGLFRLKIEELVPWNISNAAKDNFTIDIKNCSLWSVDERFKVKLDATLMAYYVFIYENPDVNIDEMFSSKKEILKNCLNKCYSGSNIFEQCLKECEGKNAKIVNKQKKDFEKELKKRISAINKKVCIILGDAYSIVIENGSYYIPISKNITERPDF